MTETAKPRAKKKESPPETTAIQKAEPGTNGAAPTNGTGDPLAGFKLEIDLDNLLVRDIVILESMGEPSQRLADAVGVLERCVVGGVRHMSHKVLPQIITTVVSALNRIEAETKVSPQTVKAMRKRLDIDGLTIGDLEILESIGQPNVLFSKVAGVLDRAVEGGIMELHHSQLAIVVEAVMDEINAVSNPEAETGQGN